MIDGSITGTLDFFKTTRPSLGPTQPVLLPPGFKRPGRKANCRPSVSNEWSCTSITLTCVHDNDRNNLTFEEFLKHADAVPAFIRTAVFIFSTSHEDSTFIREVAKGLTTISVTAPTSEFLYHAGLRIAKLATSQGLKSPSLFQSPSALRRLQ
jgi:hypothetical protein